MPYVNPSLTGLSKGALLGVAFAFRSDAGRGEEGAGRGARRREAAGDPAAEGQRAAAPAADALLLPEGEPEGALRRCRGVVSTLPVAVATPRRGVLRLTPLLPPPPPPELGPERTSSWPRVKLPPE